MKVLSAILALATAISSTAAADPAGQIITYLSPGCVDSGLFGDAVKTPLPVNTCTTLPLFFSFQGALVSACPKGKTPMVTAYFGKKCTGTSVSGGMIPAEEKKLGACSDTIVKDRAGRVSDGGRSAIFTCA